MSSDLRARYTKMFLRNNLLEMLKEKPLNKISVKSLCEKSEINRSTFYTYYQDVYDLFQQIEDEFIQKIYQLNTPLTLPEDKQMQKNIYKKLCQFYYDNRESLLAISGENGDPAFTRHIINKTLLWTKQIQKEKTLNYKKEIEQKYAVTYLFQGTLSIIYEWLNDNSSMSVDELSELLYRLNFMGIDSTEGE